MVMSSSLSWILRRFGCGSVLALFVSDTVFPSKVLMRGDLKGLECISIGRDVHVDGLF